MKVYSAPLADIAYAARAGAAGQAARQNAEIAIQQANHAASLQLQADHFAQQTADRQANREYDLQDRREARAADQTIAEQRYAQARQHDERNHEQAVQLQQSQQAHAFGISRAEQLDKDVAAAQKTLTSMSLTPEGKRLASKRLAELAKLREANRGGWLRPADHVSVFSKWLANVADDNLDAHQVQEVTPEQHLAANAVDATTGRPIDWQSPPKSILARRRDKQGNFYWTKIELADPKAEKKSEAVKSPAERLEDPKVYGTEFEAAKKRLEDAAKDSGESVALTPTQIHAEILRYHAERERFVNGLRNGFAAPPIPTSPSSPASSPAGFTPNTSPVPPVASQPAPTPAKPEPTPDTTTDQPQEVGPGLLRVAHPDMLATVKSDPQLAQFALTAADGSTVLPKAVYDEAISRTPSVGAESNKPATSTPDTKPESIEKKPASIESAIEDGAEQKFKFGDAELVTRRQLKLADGKRLAVASIDIGGRKVRSVHTGGAWRILHVGDDGEIQPIGTLPGPDAGSKNQPIEFDSKDTAAISVAVPKGTWLRDESGTLYENE